MRSRILIGMALCCASVQCGLLHRTQRCGMPRMPLRLRGGADPSGYSAAPAGAGYQAGYQPSPAAMQVDWDTPAAAPTPAPATPQLRAAPAPVPFTAPSPGAFPPAAANTPKAPAFDQMSRASAPLVAQMPAAPVAAKDDVAWDEDEDEKLSRQDLMECWDFVGPFFYLGIGCLMSHLYAMFKDGGDDGVDDALVEMLHEK